MKTLSRLLPLVASLAAGPVFANPPVSHPGATVAPGTVSMSAGASHDLLETLSEYMNPQEMESVRQFLRDTILRAVRNEPLDMAPELATRLNEVRTQLVVAERSEAVKSLDISIGPMMRAALAKQNQP